MYVNYDVIFPQRTGLQYTAALVMGMGLAMLTAADVFSAESMTPGMLPAGSSSSLSARHVGGAIGPFIGPILLAVSTIIDSIIPNLQEQLLQIAKVKTSAMILVSNAIMCIVLLAYTAYTGELAAAYGYCAVHRDASGVLFVQGICAYLGLRCYLAIIREHGGVVGVLMANARKVLTIVLSFVLFSKPFHRGHFLGLALVCSGVYLGSKKAEKKKGPTTRRDGVVVVGRGTQSSTDEKRGEEATDRHHEHSV
jgi:drug/metabolite transporter (DMT)-like permease